jgi:Sec7-like guanine-nucleotide exchange factor
MSYILRTVRPANLQNWIAANASGSLKATARESWRAYLLANSGVGQSLRDLEMSFLAAAGSSGGTLHDRWSANLTAQSGSKGAEKARSKYS